MRSLAALFLLSAPIGAQERPTRVPTAALAEGVAGVRKLLDNGASTSGIKLANDRLADQFPRVTPTVRPNLIGWDQEPVSGEKADIRSIITSSGKRLRESRSVPPPQVAAAHRRAAELAERGDVRFSGSLGPNIMGVFFLRDRTIGLNALLQYLGMKLGHVLLFAGTLAHEVGHALDSHLASKGTIAGELPALKLSYDCLVFFDPRGERLALLRAVLAKELRRRPNALTRAALDYATSLDVLRGTGGEERKLRAYAFQVGYRDGHDHESAAPAHPLN